MKPSRSLPGAAQLRLALGRAPSHERDQFVISASNESAVATLDAWPGWPGGRLALIGPAGSGKSHLARAWADAAGAVIAEGEALDLPALAGRHILAEDADRYATDETLFHLINMADAGATLLITGRSDPSSWPARLPDLRSRLNALVVATIAPPDDAILVAALRRFFRERNIRPGEDVVSYLVHRIERSIPAAFEIVRKIDAFADAEKREITRALARHVLEGEDKTQDLFD